MRWCPQRFFSIPLRFFNWFLWCYCIHRNSLLRDKRGLRIERTYQTEHFNIIRSTYIVERTWLKIWNSNSGTQNGCVFQFKRSTVKSGNVVTFFSISNNFFLRILFRWSYAICCDKIRLNKGLDVGKDIFGFCQHLGAFFMLEWRHYPPVM